MSISKQVPDKIKPWLHNGIRFLQQFFRGFIRVSLLHYL